MQAISTYTRLINAVLEHAVRLSRGEISPPRIFDPGALTPPIVEPAPIPLQRVDPLPPLAPNAMPALVGLPAEPVVDILSCVNLEGVDHCLGFLGPSVNVLANPRGLADFFFVVTRSGARPDVRGDASQPGAIVRSQFPPATVEVTPGAEFIIEVGI
jgi:hypothetical protein